MSNGSKSAQISKHGWHKNNRWFSISHSLRTNCSRRWRYNSRWKEKETTSKRFLCVQTHWMLHKMCSGFDLVSMRAIFFLPSILACHSIALISSFEVRISVAFFKTKQFICSKVRLFRPKKDSWLNMHLISNAYINDPDWKCAHDSMPYFIAFDRKYANISIDFLQNCLRRAAFCLEFMTQNGNKHRNRHFQSAKTSRVPSFFLFQ